jgi:hypothetical protein
MTPGGSAGIASEKKSEIRAGEAAMAVVYENDIIFINTKNRHQLSC